ncbi:MAG: DUF6702 family protein [Chitinophagaceae bacterium]
MIKIIVSMAASVYKWLAIPFLAVALTAAKPPGFHPFHVSVIEINHNVVDKNLEISCKIFTDDFEKVLIKNYKTKVDLINPPNKEAMDSLVKKYLFNHLSIQVNGKPVSFSYIGFENEGEAAYGYIEIININALNKLEVATNIMYDQFDDQINIIHLTINGTNRKSNKVTFPSTTTLFTF